MAPKNTLHSCACIVHTYLRYTGTCECVCCVSLFLCPSSLWRRLLRKLLSSARTGRLIAGFFPVARQPTACGMLPFPSFTSPMRSAQHRPAHPALLFSLAAGRQAGRPGRLAKPASRLGPHLRQVALHHSAVHSLSVIPYRRVVQSCRHRPLCSLRATAAGRPL